MTWTAEIVVYRLIRAADTLRRMPGGGLRPAGFRSAWPAVRDEWADQLARVGAEETRGRDRSRLAPPRPGEIDRMYQCMDWMVHVDDPEHRKALMIYCRDKAHGWRFSRTCRKLGWNRRTAYNRKHKAAQQLAAVLNNNMVALPQADIDAVTQITANMGASAIWCGTMPCFACAAFTSGCKRSSYHKCHCVHCTVWYTVGVMKRILEIAVTMALCGLVAGCETSGLSLFGDDETPTSVASPGDTTGLAGDLPPINSGLTADNPQLPANIGRYSPPQRYYELILDGFPRGTECKVEDAHGRVSKRGGGRRLVVRIRGYPSVGTVICSTENVQQFVIDTNKWAFTQPRRAGLREGDIEKVYLEVEYSLSAAKLRPIANMTMHTSAGTFQERFVLDNLKPPAPAQYGTQPQYALPPG